jgi:hypothetical protein
MIIKTQKINLLFKKYKKKQYNRIESTAFLLDTSIADTRGTKCRY